MKFEYLVEYKIGIEAVSKGEADKLARRCVNFPKTKPDNPIARVECVYSEKITPLVAETAVRETK